MKKWLILLLLPLTACNCEDDNLKEVCPLPVPCYMKGEEVVIHSPEDPYRLSTEFPSQCKLGLTKCDPKTFELTCEGFQGPTQEQCDGLDNNCNTMVDETTTIFFGDDNNDCVGLGVCKYSDKVCVDGKYECRAIFEDSIGVERCDGLDNDCDGETDEDTLEEPLFQDRWVYDGPWETEGVGECRPGRKKCIQGTEVIEGMVLPVPEVCSDNKDNDCDFLVDEVDNPDYEGAFALVIDVSGSMGLTIETVAAAVCEWSDEGILGQSKFAVTLIGIVHESVYITQIMHGLNFTDSAGLCEYLTERPWEYLTGWAEYQPLGVLSTHRELPMLNSDATVDTVETDGGVFFEEKELEWPDDLDKKVVVFTDEEMYSHVGSINNTSAAQNEVVDNCLENSYQVGVFTPFFFQQDWNPIVDECDGFVDGLYYTEEELKDRLLYNFTGGC